MITDGASLKDIVHNLCSSVDGDSPVISTAVLLDPETLTRFCVPPVAVTIFLARHTKFDREKVTGCGVACSS
jgi:hypothetical protein